jgi:cytochrome c553
MAASLHTLSLRLAAVTLVLLAAAAGQAQEGSAEAGQSKAATCGACHGPDGNSVTPEWPNLAGQHERYTVRQLEAYQNGERRDVGMQGFASMLSEQDMQDVAAYYATQSLAPRGADPDLVMLGQQIYRGGIPERGVAACIACHGPTGMGNPMAAYPRIGGQHSAYLLSTLQAYASGERRSDADMNQMMRNVSELLFENEMRALASYVQGLR